MTELQKQSDSELATTLANHLASCGLITSAKAQEIAALPFIEALEGCFDIEVKGLSEAGAQEYKHIVTEVDQRVAALRAKKKAMTDRERAEAKELGMSEAEYLAARQDVQAKYGTAAPASQPSLDTLTDREKAEARELNMSEADYLAAKREIAAKNGAA